MMGRSFSTVALWLLPMLILLSVGPSGNNNVANKSPDFEVSWNWQHYAKKDEEKEPEQQRFQPHMPDIYTLFKQLDDLERMDAENPGKVPNPSNSPNQIHTESLPVESQTHIRKQDKNPEFLKPLNLEVLNNAGVGKLEQNLSFQRDNDWEGKAFEGQSNPMPSGTPRTMAGSSPRTTYSPTKTTAVIRPSSFCLSDPTPFRPATTKCPNPQTSTTIRTTPRPPPPPSTTSTTSMPITSKLPSGPKSRKKSKHLSAKTAKILLETILTTKQHVLSVLKTLNYLEMEVLSQSPEDCPLQGLGHSQPKKTCQKFPKPSASRHSQTFFFGIRPASQMESDSVMALAREEELKLKSRVWEEYQQHMRDMLPSKSRRFHRTPQADVQLVAIREPQGPQEPLEHKNPLKQHLNKDTSALAATWNGAA
ncbi:hypothetical protein KR032_010766 [Drosophila birchii]|nr:hypothetical protein KR032_010766 [Drosophila birchii]